MNIPDATFVKSTQSSPTTECDHILEDRYGYLLIFTRVGDCLTSGQSYKSLMRFIGPNWDTKIIHKSPMRFIALFCLGLGPLQA